MINVKITTALARRTRAAGKCTSCFMPNDQDRWLCSACTARVRARKTKDARREYRRQRVARGICLQCGDKHENVGKANCPACALKRREYMRDYARTRRATDPGFALACRLRTRITDALRERGIPAASRAGSHVRDLGCTVGELVRHLESKFPAGMSWENRDEWHVDHIKPLSSFDLTDPEEFKRAAHYSNLQPLWAQENLQKHAA